MKPDVDILDLRCLWALYVAGDWITVALLLRDWNAALWDFDGASSGCDFASASGEREI